MSKRFKPGEPFSLLFFKKRVVVQEFFIFVFFRSRIWKLIASIRSPFLFAQILIFLRRFFWSGHWNWYSERNTESGVFTWGLGKFGEAYRFAHYYGWYYSDFDDALIVSTFEKIRRKVKSNLHKHWSSKHPHEDGGQYDIYKIVSDKIEERHYYGESLRFSLLGFLTEIICC